MNLSDNIFMATTEQISIRLPKNLLELLDYLSKRDLRTRTNLIEYILMNWLREHEPREFDDEGNIQDLNEPFNPG
jgi:metal-responsive CopG/Arc/MetJ family transcriptional regulator